MIQIRNTTKHTTLAMHAKLARTFIQRLVGLLGRDSLESEEALIFYSVASIHMYFMKFPIDVIFLDKAGKILKICHSLKPWQAASCFKATTTMELPAGKCIEKSTEMGDYLEIITP